LVTLSSSSWPIGPSMTFHMSRVAKQKRQVEDVEVVDHRAQGADADPGELQCADLRLLDRLPSRRRAALTHTSEC
jgi:hypothetical protein